MKSNRRKLVAIALTFVLILIATTAIYYNAQLEDYMAIYVLSDDTGIGVHIRATSKSSAQKKAERHTKEGAQLIVVLEYDPNEEVEPPTIINEEDVHYDPS